MSKKNLFYVGLLLLFAIGFAACGSDDENSLENIRDEHYRDHVLFTGYIEPIDFYTRSLIDRNINTIATWWYQDEEIAILYGGKKYIATVNSVNGYGNAEFFAWLPKDTPNNQKVTYIYPAAAADGSGIRSDLLASQDGTLENLSTTLGLATGEGTLIIDGDQAHPNGTIKLQNHFAICKFQFTDEIGQAITDIKRLTITNLATSDVITVTAPTPTSVLYVAMLPASHSSKIELECSSGAHYNITVTDNLEAGVYYNTTLQMVRERTRGMRFR